MDALTIDTPAMRLSERSIRNALDAANRAKYPDDDFMAGDCHNLAIALYETFGELGQLVACLRSQVDEDSGNPFCTGFSHMVYQDQHGRLWDIDGPGADVRWEESFSEDADEDGLVSRFNWVVVSYDEIQSWLHHHYACYDAPLVGRIKREIRRESILDPEPMSRPRMRSSFSKP